MNADLFVTSGPNRGAYVPLPSGRHSVGASEDADIVLEGAPLSGTLVFEVGTDRIRVTPVGGLQARVDGRVLGRAGANLQAGSVIELGETELRAFWDESEGGAVSPRASSGASWALRFLGITVVGVGSALLLADMWGRDMRQQGGSSEGGGAVPKPIPQALAKPEANGKLPRLPEPVAGTMLEGVEARVKAVLRGTGLTGKTEAGRLVVTGSVLTAKDEKRLEAMIAEVRPYIEVDVSGVRGLGGGNASAPATSPVQVVAPAKIVAINIVTSGPAKSYFETQDGARYFEGAVFGDGYVVSEIRPTVVAMEKGGRKLEYTLTGR